MIVGRRSECARIEALLTAARSGQSGALILQGEPGIGKTVLLEHAAACAEGFTVLRAVGVPSEANLGFSGLLTLLRPVLDHLDAVPQRQAEALGGILGLTRQTSLELHLAFAGMLSLLAAAAETRPVLCLIDDAQWLDRGSAGGVAFVARRIEAERIAMVASVRIAEAGVAEYYGIESAMLDGLDPDAAHELLRAGEVRLDASVAARLIEATAANPLALLEVPSVLTEAQRTGRESLEDPVAVSARVEQAFMARAGALSLAAQWALLIAAVSSDGDLNVIMTAAGDAVAGIDEAQAARLIEVRGEEVTFRHPLVRSAIYSAAGANGRRDAHLALAGALRDDPRERGMWHRAAAALGPDDELADALAAAAERSAPRSVADEQRLYEQAARLTVDPALRALRSLAACSAAYRAGHSHEAIVMSQAGLELTEHPDVRADLLLLQLHAARGSGDQNRLLAALELARDVRARTDPTRFSELAYVEWSAAYDALDLSLAREIVEDARARVGEEFTWKSSALLTAITWQSIADENAVPPVEVARRGAALEMARDGMTGWAVDFAEGLTVLEDYVLARRVLARAADEWRSRGAVRNLTTALAARAELELRAGHVGQARVAAHEAVGLAEENRLDHWRAWALAGLAAVDAVVGDPDGRTRAQSAIELAANFQDADTEARALDALGRIELGEGDAEAAVPLLERAGELVAAIAAPGYRLWAPDLIEAYARCNRTDDARRELAAFARRVERRPGRWATAAVARCRALMADDAEIDRAFGAADALCDHALVSPFERARCALVWGERLRRAGHRRAARERLQTALLGFERLGATSWADRAHEELRASGQTVRARDPTLVNELTPRELEVALLAAGGATNREIANRLYLSPKTIELHLGRVYRKLGLRSRTELARSLPTGTPRDPVPERSHP